MLKKGGGEAAFVQRREGANGVVAQDDGGVTEVDLKRGGLKGEDPARASRRTWWRMSSESGRVPTKTLPSQLSHQRRTMPQQWREASHVMVAMRAGPVSPARKAA